MIVVDILVWISVFLVTAFLIYAGYDALLLSEWYKVDAFSYGSTGPVVDLSHLVTISKNVEDIVLAGFLAIVLSLICYVFIMLIACCILNSISSKSSLNSMCLSVPAIIFAIVTLVVSTIVSGVHISNKVDKKIEALKVNNTTAAIKNYATEVIDESRFLVNVKEYSGVYDILENRIVYTLPYPDYVVTNSDAFKVEKLTYKGSDAYIQYVRIDNQEDVDYLIQQYTDASNTVEEVPLDATQLKINEANKDSTQQEDVEVDVKVDVKVNTK